MNNLYTVVGGAAVVVLLVITGLLAAQVGGVAIRGASLTYEIDTLELTDTVLLPGVPVTVTVNDGLSRGGRSSVLLLRLPTGSMTVGDVGSGELEAGVFRVVVPCDSVVPAGAREVAARLVLVDQATQAVLAQSRQLELLPPGPDCLFSD